MVQSGKDRDTEATERPAHDPARPANPMSDLPYFSEALSLNPLLANPAAAMAAATAIGFGFANQMASAFFGVMQGALETANRQGAVKEAEVAPVKAEAPVVAEPAKAPEVVAEAVELPKAKPASKPVAQKATVQPVGMVIPEAAVKPKPKKATKLAAGIAPAAVVEPALQAVIASAPEAVIKAAAKTRKVSVKPADGDLKGISGIGPKLEGLLKEKGVTVAKIAAWTNKDIARFDKELGFEGRIVRDDWVGQAKALLK
ncbi:5' DNA nuclease [Rhizobium sp. XQZ8]|uniref:5' DNA nuclease n=1 Tax=Rhizobium populisoli TaxID=2859785 RepID=UPI001CA52F20|nr:5' DNA nuclease [Rhizobium populisoli]MBW6420384.1 5' DNA nuclease [Rhizobium populisoli]